MEPEPEYRTISEVVNPLYVDRCVEGWTSCEAIFRQAKKPKTNKEASVFWSQVSG